MKKSLLELGNECIEYTRRNSLAAEDDTDGEIAHLILEPDELAALGSPNLAVVYPANDDGVVSLNLFVRNEMHQGPYDASRWRNVAHLTLPMGNDASERVLGYVVNTISGQTESLTDTQIQIAITAIQLALNGSSTEW